jgi:sporulation protein YlmC with PRC-barrel domain
MKRSLKNLIGYSLETSDGSKGKIKDFLFDEELWVVGYLEADFGGLFQNNRVLIPTALIQNPNWDHNNLQLDITQERIRQCPGLEDKMPVSKQYEKLLREHYNFKEEWFLIDPLSPVTHNAFASDTLRGPTRSIDEKDLDTSLRSFKEIKGYSIHANDGQLGQVDDLIFDDKNWRIVFTVVDTSTWLPWSKKVILSITWLKEISYLKHEVQVDLLTDTIKEAPEYQEGHIYEVEQETALFDYYNEKNHNIK